MGKIICIIGKSSSGKDTIYKILSDQLDVLKNVMYTTRPIRVGEIDGVNYHYVNDQIYNYMVNNNMVIESRSYNTEYGVWTYFTSSTSFDLENNDYIVVNTLEGYSKLKDYFGKDVMIPVYIEIDDGLRLTRALNREKLEEKPKYEEMCRRFIADQRDFSDDRILELGINKRFQNVDLDSCISEIVDYLSNFGINRKQKNKILEKR